MRIRRAPVFPCTEQGIRDAIAYGGGINYFDCDCPTHVPTAAEIVIENGGTLNAEDGLLTRFAIRYMCTVPSLLTCLM